MPFLVIIGLGLVLFGASEAFGMMNVSGGLKDISPDEQGGSYKKDFDQSFVRASKKRGVPFALIKAHAIAESSLNPKAFRDESSGRSDRVGWASRGLMQILWWPKSERWKKYGYPDSVLGSDGSVMFDPDTNTDIAAALIKDNLKACDGNLRDVVNMYNTGKKESQYQAPHGYVDKVLGYYNKIIGV